MAKVLGIDLGTTNSCVAVVEVGLATGRPEPRRRAHDAFDRRLHRGRRAPRRPDREAPGDHESHADDLRRQAPHRPQVVGRRGQARPRAPLLHARRGAERGREDPGARPGLLPGGDRRVRPARDQGVLRGGARRGDQGSDHHGPGLLRRLAAAGDARRGPHRGPRGPPDHQRAHGGRARVRPREEPQAGDDRRLRPRRRHVRHLDPPHRQRDVRGALDVGRHVPRRRGLRPDDHGLAPRRVPAVERAST